MSLHKNFELTARDRTIRLGAAPVVMGIVNATPDSFSDGGDNFAPEAAYQTASKMLTDGAGMIDIGGESTRPGAEDVSAQDELDRVNPLLEMIAANPLDATISIDTRKAIVAHQALERGAHIINDVMGLQGDPDMAAVAAQFSAPVIAMHWQPDGEHGDDIINAEKRFFDASIEIALKAGLREELIVLDPGFGFSKTLEENYTLLRRLSELQSFGLPILVGMSRKSMLGKLLGNEPKERGAATIATSVLAYMAGAHIFRVHEVRQNADALAVSKATLYGPNSSAE